MKKQSGEIATVLTLVSVGLMLAGLVVGNVAVQQTTKTQSRAQTTSECSLVSCKSDRLKAWLNLPDNQISDKSVYLSTDGSKFYTNGTCADVMSDDEGRNICTASSASTPTATTAPPNQISCNAPNSCSYGDCWGEGVIPGNCTFTDPNGETHNNGICCKAGCYNLTNCQKTWGGNDNNNSLSAYTDSSGDKYYPSNNCTGTAMDQKEMKKYCGEVVATPPATDSNCVYAGTCYSVFENDFKSANKLNCLSAKPLYWDKEREVYFENAQCNNVQHDRDSAKVYCTMDTPACSSATLSPTTSSPVSTPGAECLDKLKDNPQANCKDTSNIACKPGNTWYKCIEGGSCPYDNRVGIGYPYLCGSDGKTSYNMNAAGECTWACQPPNQPSPTPNASKCGGKENGYITNSCLKMQCAPNPNKANKNYWIKIEEACQNGAVYEKPGAFTDMECTLKSGYEIFADCGGTVQNPPKPTEVPDKRVPGGGPPPTSGPPSAGTQYCLPFQCPNNTQRFSVKNRKLYNTGDCSGDPVGAYSSVCGGNLGTGCDLVSGGKDKGICRENLSDCPSGKAFPRWGPLGNDVDINLCSGLNGLCCEPAGGFKPEALPTLYQPQPTVATQAVGNKDTGCSYAFPNSIVKGNPFSVAVTTKIYNLASGIKLKINQGSTEVVSKDAEGAIIRDGKSPGDPDYGKSWTYTTWNFNDVKINQTGTFTMNLSFDNSGSGTNQSAKSCANSQQITVNETSSLAPTGTAPKCNVVVDSMTEPCAQCMNSNLSISVNCPTTKQKINLYCTNPQNINTCSTVFDNTCVKSSDSNKKCTPQERPLLFLSPLSFDNNSFDTVVQGVKSGLINAKYASLYVTSATRAPGLQRQYCDPFKGQCDFYYQQNL